MFRTRVTEADGIIARGSIQFYRNIGQPECYASFPYRAHTHTLMYRFLKMVPKYLAFVI